MAARSPGDDSSIGEKGPFTNSATTQAEPGASPVKLSGPVWSTMTTRDPVARSESGGSSLTRVVNAIAPPTLARGERRGQKVWVRARRSWPSAPPARRGQPRAGHSAAAGADGDHQLPGRPDDAVGAAGRRGRAAAGARRVGLDL